MNCEQVRLELHEAHDRGTRDALPETVRTHLATCPACRELEDDLASLSRALRGLPVVPLPPETLEAVWRETVRAKPATWTSTAGFWRFAAAASFAAALSTATLYFVFSPTPPRGPSPVELAKAEAQAEMVFGYTARALNATRVATTERVLASKVSPAVRGAAAPPSRRP